MSNENYNPYNTDIVLPAGWQIVDVDDDDMPPENARIAISAVMELKPQFSAEEYVLLREIALTGRYRFRYFGESKNQTDADAFPSTPSFRLERREVPGKPLSDDDVPYGAMAWRPLLDKERYEQLLAKLRSGEWRVVIDGSNGLIAVTDEEMKQNQVAHRMGKPLSDELRYLLDGILKLPADRRGVALADMVRDTGMPKEFVVDRLLQIRQDHTGRDPQSKCYDLGFNYYILMGCNKRDAFEWMLAHEKCSKDSGVFPKLQEDTAPYEEAFKRFKYALRYRQRKLSA